jgi:hypothetical protein
VFILDELDRLPPRASEEVPGFSVAQVLFDVHSSDLREPRAHLIYTFPSQLLVQANLGRSWSEKPAILPAVKIRQRTGNRRFQPGREALRRVVEARVEVPAVFAAPRLVTELADFSGGYVRDLIRLVRFAANRTDGVVGRAEVEGAKRDLVNVYSYQVAEHTLPLLAEIDRTKRLPPESQFAELLERNLVLTYWNDEEWADVHPAVRATRAYRDYQEPEAS